ncbi:beta-2-microglobulin-like [Pholidichthys leucotaenia]
MKLLLWVSALLAVCCSVDSKHSSPRVQVYSHNPGEFGKGNILICHVSDFYPPDITIELLKDEAELPGAKQSDLVFRNNWQFRLLKHVGFTPNEGESYRCRVTHGGVPKDYAWDPNM